MLTSDRRETCQVDRSDRLVEKYHTRICTTAPRLLWIHYRDASIIFIDTEQIVQVLTMLLPYPQSCKVSAIRGWTSLMASRMCRFRYRSMWADSHPWWLDCRIRQRCCSGFRKEIEKSPWRCYLLSAFNLECAPLRWTDLQYRRCRPQGLYHWESTCIRQCRPMSYSWQLDFWW